ncbi:MAG: hypothetical protein HKN53_01185, partial [Maribacter sp.]|nr:hypothetical protein [Maribacter sp.]
MKKVLLILILLISYCVSAQKSIDLNYYLPQNVTYDENIPTPKEVIGHEVGEWHVTHDKLMFYMQTLAKKSDRITIETRG